MKQQGGSSESSLGKYLSDQSVNSERIADLKKLMPEATAEFQKSRIR